MTHEAEDREARFRAEVDGTPTISEEQYRKRSRRSFIGFAAAAAAAAVGFNTVQNRPQDLGIPDVLRGGLRSNEALWNLVGSDTRSSRTFDVAQREDIRVNGRIGLEDDLDPASWRIRVIGVDSEEIDSVDLGSIRSLPTRDMVTEHKCVEGWSNIVHWTGARFRDLAERYYASGAVPRDHRYVSLRTPDDEYYVGLDRSVTDHRQTLLAWGLNGEPLTAGHGAPLRLATPLVYGIKQLKRVGTIEFTNTRPADYWAERGYDWHARF